MSLRRVALTAKQSNVEPSSGPVPGRCVAFATQQRLLTPNSRLKAVNSISMQAAGLSQTKKPSFFRPFRSFTAAHIVNKGASVSPLRTYQSSSTTSHWFRPSRKSTTVKPVASAASAVLDPVSNQSSQPIPPPLPNPPVTSRIQEVIPYLVQLALSERQLYWRLGLAFACMVLSKAAGLACPLLLREAVNHLSAQSMNFAIMALLSYGLAGLIKDVAKEMQHPFFTPVSQAVARRVSYHTFSHVLDLDMKFHLDRRTGRLAKVLERGARSVYMLYRSLVFTFMPTAIELVFVCALLWTTFSPAVAGVVGATFVAYVAYTLELTQRSTEVRKQLNTMDNMVSSKAVDALLNYETVALFNNQRLEVGRYDSYLQGYQKSAIQLEVVAHTLGAGQAIILTIGLTSILLATLLTAPAPISPGDIVMVQGLILQLWAPLMFLGWFYRELRQSLVDMEEYFQILQTQTSLPDGNNPLPTPATEAPTTLKFVNGRLANGHTAAVGSHDFVEGNGAPNGSLSGSNGVSAGHISNGRNSSHEGVGSIGGGNGAATSTSILASQRSPLSSSTAPVLGSSTGSNGVGTSRHDEASNLSDSDSEVHFVRGMSIDSIDQPPPQEIDFHAASSDGDSSSDDEVPDARTLSHSEASSSGTQNGSHSTVHVAVSRAAGWGLKVELKDVRFGYQGERPILQGVTLEVPSGTSLAVVGPSGSGKSTILKLITRLYDVQEGSVVVNGMDVRDIRLKELRQAIAVVPQDTVLFNDSVMENIRYGRPDASDEEVIQAAKMARLHDAVLRMKDGFQTVVGERGLKLSGGEKQRVAIARAFLKAPRLLVCDEATSALDSATESAIMSALSELAEGRTSIFVAHRLSTIRGCDKIVVLNHGQVEEVGSHEELLSKKGLYASMWDMQAAEEAKMREQLPKNEEDEDAAPAASLSKEPLLVGQQ